MIYLAGDMLSQLTTDILGAVLSPFTDLLGPVFPTLIVVIFFLPMINRIGVEPVIIIGVLSWSMFTYILPGGALNLGMVIILIAGTSIITILFFSRRREVG